MTDASVERTLEAIRGTSSELPKVMAHTWTSIDLVAAAANPPKPPSIGGMLYPRKRTLISGERDSLKTWLATLLAKSEMDAGFAVGWADVDAMGAAEIIDRLRLLGVEDETISRLFLYYAPAERLIGDALLDVAAELRERQARLFIGDAFNPFLSLHGLDPNSTSDVETFWREVADPISRAGAAPTMLDHVVKNASSRGHYAYGSERKASGALVHLGTRIVTPFGRGRVGASVLECHRDRQGYLPRPKIGLLELSATDSTITYSITETGDAGTFRPTTLMERVSRHLEKQGEAISKDAIEANVKGKTDGLRAAIAVLLSEGFAVESPGARGAKLIESVRPYRAAEDDHAERESTSPLSSPQLAPYLVSFGSVEPKGEEARSKAAGGAKTTSPPDPSPIKGEVRGGRPPRPFSPVKAGSDITPEDAGPPEFDPYGDELDRMRIKKVLTPEQDAAIDAYFAARDGEA